MKQAIVKQRVKVKCAGVYTAIVEAFDAATGEVIESFQADYEKRPLESTARDSLRHVKEKLNDAGYEIIEFKTDARITLGSA